MIQHTLLGRLHTQHQAPGKCWPPLCYLYYCGVLFHLSSTYPSFITYSYIHLSFIIQPPNHPSSIYTSIHLSFIIHSFIYSFIIIHLHIFYSLIIHPCHSSFNSSFTHHPSTHVTITHSCIHQSIHVLFVYPLTIQPASIPLSIHSQFIYPSIHLCIHHLYSHHPVSPSSFHLHIICPSSIY